jgi:hypothetical protein
MDADILIPKRMPKINPPVDIVDIMKKNDFIFEIGTRSMCHTPECCGVESRTARRALSSPLLAHTCGSPAPDARNVLAAGRFL